MTRTFFSTWALGLLVGCGGLNAVGLDPQDAGPGDDAVDTELPDTEPSEDSDVAWETAFEDSDTLAESDAPATPFCGNSTVDVGEVCDGSDLNGTTCLDFGYDGGALGCLPDCSDFLFTFCSGSGGGGVTGTATCNDSCIWADDGTCDDGGPGSLFSVCGLGTDCTDCGDRASVDTDTDALVDTDDTDAGTTGGGVTGTATCNDSCTWADDGTCDDGGPGSLFSVCGLGTDCTDCGDRASVDTDTDAPLDTDVPVETDETDAGTTGGGTTGGTTTCLNTCVWAGDGTCDDGGPGSLFSVCDFGTDCDDCGARTGTPTTPTATCSDTCIWANDGTCDDGGPGSLFSVCDFGADCSDCGDRAGISPGGTGGGTGVCTDTCTWANDGTCDDGGPGSSYSVCSLGSDCADCGVR